MNIVTQLDKNQLTRSTDSSNHRKAYEPEVNPDPKPSSSDFSETLSSDSRAKKKKITKKKKRRKHRKDDSLDPYSSDDSDSSNDCHYRRKRLKNKKHLEKDQIKLYATLTAKWLTTVYKSKIIKLSGTIGEMTRQTHLRATTMILPMTFMEDASDAKIRTIRKRIRSNYAQL